VYLAGELLVNKSIFFISDTHFQYHRIEKKEMIKKEKFLRFLKEIRGASRLYLVGDIFDFWFEYKNTIPKHYWDILYNLRTLREEGTSIHITGGNHDFWLGSFIEEEMGFEILPEISTHKLQGKTVTISHGDMLMPGDLKYKILKRVIRGRLAIRLAKMLHPDLLFRFAGWFSSTSKDFTEGKTESCANRLAELAEDSFFKWGNDSFVMGHVHKPLLKHLGNKIFVILGDWENHFSYLRLKDGEFSTGNYKGEEKRLIENL
jgi:UDP-2,3-diacylglucosamine hydrolase